MSSTTTELGPLVRRWGLPVKQLPSATAGPDELKPFFASILKEALPFIDSAAPKTSSDAKKLWKSKGAKSSPDSDASVDVLERRISAKELQAIASKHGIKADIEEETWATRLSVHEDAAKKGTASWDEFEHSFRLEHAKTEMAFTPNVIAANEAQRWDCAGIELEEGGQSWDRFQLVVEEMRHKVGRPFLKDRTFPVLQLSCAVKDGTGASPEFVIVSIPVPDFATSDKANLSKEKGALIAFYVSIERIRKLDNGKIEWLLGTASDAAGVLPLWIQDIALLGIVWKDVPMFLGWIAKERGKSDGKAMTSDAKETEQTPQVTTGVETGPTPAVTGPGAETTTGSEAVVEESNAEATTEGTETTTKA
ncbi:hypothetical protein F5B22DRAFT_592282 [Xylaria bambusicola]|uniref:uncharacterized protein n=1 Tax=Xylaria bambusicola TaxID=326684 RepID=UPI0020076143|nr:uncharacterized protein F5B22DRAFT_592282 [Xylaria bambusicola]KAI0523856.1 hypothetical protein F5B22DRAFT_592282 [Xylaria bambusicola]